MEERMLNHIIFGYPTLCSTINLFIRDTQLHLIIAACSTNRKKEKKKKKETENQPHTHTPWAMNEIYL